MCGAIKKLGFIVALARIYGNVFKVMLYRILWLLRMMIVDVLIP